MTPLALHLRSVVFAVWAAASPAAPKQHDASAIADAIASTVAADDAPPVFGSPDADAAVVGYWAWRESQLDLHAVNPAGKSFGAWQQGVRCGRAAAWVQARCWLDLLHRGASRCPDHPTAIVWGRCHGRDVLTGKDIAELAAGRERQALELLQKARADGTASGVAERQR